MVGRVRAALNVRFQGGRAPRVLFTDRGNGFFHPGTGVISDKYASALARHGLRAFFPQNAGIQPGQLQEVMLHETAVSWIRARFQKTLPRRAWEEHVDAYATRLKDCATHINSRYDVDGLCKELPLRLEELDRRKGDRLAK